MSSMARRRRWRAASFFAAAIGLCLSSLAATDYAPVTANHPLTFPADYGSHPEFRTEWWYVTGWLKTDQGEDLGFQVTFFRTKPDADSKNPSAFAPQQLLVAHCAISDPKRGRLWQDQRIRRAGMGLAEAKTGDTDVWIERWKLKHEGSEYVTKIEGDDFSFDLELKETQPVMINGNSGVSQKGPAIASASYYYSFPHLRVTGAITRKDHSNTVSGEAWLDHEWSSEYLDAEAVGWDWIGINFDDGGALMAFRIRGADGKQRWAGGTLRDADGKALALESTEVNFGPKETWRSPRTGIDYVVKWHLRAGTKSLDLTPLLNDQESDTRLSTGSIYWEGAIRATEKGRTAGLGYLELTGYGEPLRLR